MLKFEDALDGQIAFDNFNHHIKHILSDIYNANRDKDKGTDRSQTFHRTENLSNKS